MFLFIVTQKKFSSVWPWRPEALHSCDNSDSICLSFPHWLHEKFILGWYGIDYGSKMHCTPSEDCSLASNLRAQQQGIAIQQSDSSE